MKVVSMNKSFGKPLVILGELTNGIFLATTVIVLTSRRYYSQLWPCGHNAITDTRYYGQNPDPLRKL